MQFANFVYYGKTLMVGYEKIYFAAWINKQYIIFENNTVQLQLCYDNFLR